MKGDYKRRRTQFKKGHHRVVSKKDQVLPCQHGNEATQNSEASTSPPSPRPTRAQAYEQILKNTDDSETYIIARKNSLDCLWNQSVKEHNKYSCDGDLKMNKTQQWGLSSSWQLLCPSCNYKGKPHKLYQEVDMKTRGRKSSSLNNAIATALMCSSIGASQFTQIMLRIGVDPGSESTLQRNISKCAQVVRDVTDDNLRQERQQLQHKSISIQMDTAYNNNIYSDQTPFQAGTQAVTTVLDNETGKILHVETTSKLCPTGDRLRAQGQEVICGTESAHSGCKANMEMKASIGDESRYASRCAAALKQSKVDIHSVTSDGDAKIFHGLKSIFDHNIEQQRDPRHLTKALIQALKKTKFSAIMFNDPNQQRRQQRQARFSASVGHRCHAEASAALKLIKASGDSETQNKKTQIFKLLEKTPEAIVMCLSKNCHAMCKKHSLVCKDKKPWYYAKLHTQDRNGIAMTESDKTILLSSIKEKRLGVNALKAIYSGTSTQLAEAKNKSYRSVNPKNVTCSLNWDARIKGKVLFSNVGTYLGTLRLMKRLGHTLAGPVREKLKKKQYRENYIKQYQKSAFRRYRRHEKLKRTYRCYDSKQQELKCKQKPHTYKTASDAIPSTSTSTWRSKK